MTSSQGPSQRDVTHKLVQWLQNEPAQDSKHNDKIINGETTRQESTWHTKNKQWPCASTQNTGDCHDPDAKLEKHECLFIVMFITDAYCIIFLLLKKKVKHLKPEYTQIKREKINLLILNGH